MSEDLWGILAQGMKDGIKLDHRITNIASKTIEHTIVSNKMK